MASTNDPEVAPMTTDETEERKRPRAPPQAYALLDDDVEADAAAPTSVGPSFCSPEDAIESYQEAEADALQALAALPRPARSIWAVPPPNAIGGPLAHRAMRDALGLQLARRGFDGLRQSALWLVTELTADFLRALGTQMQREGPSPSLNVPSSTVVRRMQRHVNMHSLAEWRQAQLTFVRVAEPPGAGAASSRNIDQKQQANAPPAVAPLYAAMRGAWNYKASGTGRAAHATAGALATLSHRLHACVRGRKSASECERARASARECERVRESASECERVRRLALF